MLSHHTPVSPPINRHWYEQLIERYTANWRGSEKDTDDLIEFIAQYKTHPDFITTLSRFKNYIYKNPHPVYSRTERYRLFFDCSYVAERPGFTRLNNKLGELLSPDHHQSYCSLAMLAMTNITQYITTHPIESLVLLCALTLPIVTATEHCNSVSRCTDQLNNIAKQTPLIHWPEVLPDSRLAKSQLISKALANCNQALREILEEYRFPNLLSQKNLRILLVSPEFLSSPASRGSFLPDQNIIGIAYKRYHTSKDYKTILLNELFSHQVMEQNLKMKNPGSNLNYDQLISLQLKKSSVPESLTTILKKIHGRITSLKSSLDHGNLPEHFTLESGQIVPLLEIAKDYNPMKDALDLKTFELSLQMNAMRKSKRDNEFESAGSDHNSAFSAPLINAARSAQMPNSQLAAQLPKVYGKKIAGQFIFQHCELDNTPLARARCLINDLHMMFQSMYHPVYAEKEMAEQEHELASFISELPLSIQTALFPEFAAYMCKFFTEQPKVSTSPRH